jgi:transposase-like protein
VYSYTYNIIGYIMRDVPILPGEYSNWKDTGCELHSLCLECPFPRCLEDKPRGKQRVRLKMRALAMRKMRRGGISVRVVAMAFGVSVRTVQREMKRRNGLLKIVSALRS